MFENDWFSIVGAATIACCSFVALATPGQAAPPEDLPIKVKALSPYLLYFFDGRRPAERFAKDWNWLDDAAMKLGVGTYAIHQGEEAVVYDTFTSVAQAKWVRTHLEKMGIKKFKIVHSHWHLDHIAGDAAYADSDVISSAATRDALVKQKADIESGKLWGPPPIVDVRIPNVVFEGKKEMAVGDVKFELRQINIHSLDSTVIYFPNDKILLAGDTVEDSLTYMVEVENLATHVANLKVMKTWDITKIYPNHGNPEVIMGKGYDKTLIDATINYVTRVITKAHDAGYVDGKMEDYIGDSVANGWVQFYEPYRDVHIQNLKTVHEYWKDKPLPEIKP